MNETTLTGESADIVSENIQKLKEIFPEVFCEDSIDFEKLQAVLGEYTDDNEERYNFTWWGKGRALRLAQTPSMGTLRPCKEESKDWDTTQNLYIEGDNLDVLKLLQKSYHSKAKLVYIDPPYNTGNDLIYKNDFSENLENYIEFTKQKNQEGNFLSTNSETNGRYHSDWLSMMYSRIRASRTLLSEDGFFVIAIDHYELYNTGLICNEIFGEENKIAVIAVIHKPEGRNQAKFFGPSHEYFLVYAKSESNAKLQKVVLDDDLAQKFNHIDEKGRYRLKDFIRRSDGKYSLREAKPNFYYPIYVSGNLSDISLEKKPGYQAVYPIIKSGVERTWKTTAATMMERYQAGDIIAVENSGEISILEKLREDQVLKTHWIDKKYHGFHFGTKIVDSLLKVKTFDFPKSLYLMKDIIKVFTGKEDLVIDYFSGSATTAHAVMNVNAEDGGKRKFIMVQLPEPTEEKSEAYKAGYENICEIGKERIRRAGEQIKAELQAKQTNQPSMLEENTIVHPHDLDIGFKLFKLDTSNLKKWSPDADHLEESLLDAIENYVEGRSELDVVYEIMLKYGIDLTLPLDEYVVGGKKIYSVGYGALMICLDRDITTDVANEIVRLKEELKPEVMRVVFKDNGFQDDSVKTNTKEILRNAGIDEIVSV